MPIKADFKEIPVNISDGGALTPDLPIHSVRGVDFTDLTNWRPTNGVEIVKTEGWDYFAPNAEEVALAQRLNAPSGCLAIKEVSRPNGKSAVVCVAGGKIYAFSYDDGEWSEIGTGYSTTGIRYWEIEVVAGYAVFNNGKDLPCTWQVGDAAVRPHYELREQGYAFVDTIAETNGVLMCMGVAEILESELAGIMNGSDPYGTITDTTKFQHIKFLVLWSNLGDPRDMAATVTGSIASGSPTLTLAWPMASLSVGDELTIIGAGTAGGNLTTTISAIADEVITLAANAITTVSSEQVQKTTAIASVVGSYELEDDGSAAIRGIKLGNRFVIWKATGAFLVYYTGDLEEPFVFDKVYTGEDVPKFPRSLVNVGDKYLWYVGKKHFYQFKLGKLKPEIDPVTRLAEKSLFFSLTTTAAFSSVFTEVDEATNEVYLSFPVGSSRRALRRGYEDGAEYVFPVDYGFTCAASIMRPLAADSKSDTEHWFIYGGSDGKITRNGRSNTEVFTYDRYGVKFSATALSGLISFGDDSNEKRIRGYIPMLLCSSSRMGVTVSLYGTNKANKAPEFLESQTFDTDQDPAVAPFFQQQNYFQFKLVCTASAEVRFTGALWDIARIGSRSHTKSDQ